MKRLLLWFNSDLRRIGLYQLIGGVLGMIFSFQGIYTSVIQTSAVIASDVIGFLLFFYSVFCGLLCIRGYKSALAYSLVCQILQIFGFYFIGAIYRFSSGFYFVLGIDLSNSFHFVFGAGFSVFNLFWDFPNNISEFTINLIALLFSYWIFNLRKFEKFSAEIITEQSFNK